MPTSTVLPRYTADHAEQDDLDASAAPDAQAVVPSQVSFAQEVREERLSTLWRVTLFIVFVAWWTMFVISGGQDASFMPTIVPALIVAGGCLLTGQWLRMGRFHLAVWTYAFGAIAAIGILMSFSDAFGTEYAPHVFPLLVFVVGLLLPVRATVLLLVLVLGTVLGVPWLTEDTFSLDYHTVFAMLLTFFAGGLSTQVSGELYAIAEWALDNYRKERQTTYALLESREALEKSFMRQRALTQQVQEANEELERARKAEEEAKHFRGQFLANMSHELRTPLNAIIGFSQTMLDFPAMYDGVELPSQYHQDMTQILNSGKHLLSIINDILDLSKVDAGKLDLEIQAVDIGPVIKGVMSTAVGLVGDKADRVKLLQDVPDPLPRCMGDPLRVRQVLLNLYSNAAKFTDSGHIKLIVTQERGEVIFAVQDTGTGIAESDKATIFEEFRQGTAGRKRGRQGAGLGLAISQQLLRLMNGRLWFESTLGKGSTFYIALPQCRPGDENISGSGASILRPRTGRISSAAAEAVAADRS